MSPRIAAFVGLLAGILVAVLAVALVVADAPQLAGTLAPSPSATVSPSSRASGGAQASAPATAGAPALVTAAPPASPTASTASAGAGTATSTAGSTAGGSGSGSTPAATASAGGAGSPVPSVAGGNFFIGQAAPKLVLPLVGGGSIDLATLRGHPVWVNFMGTYCPPCRDEFPVMNGFAVRYATTGLIVLAVDVREDEGTIAAFAKDLRTTFPIALDASSVAQRAWRAAALPVHFWVDAKGIVRDGAVGSIGPDQMAQALATILPGVNVTP